MAHLQESEKEGVGKAIKRIQSIQKKKKKDPPENYVHELLPQ